MQLNNREEAKKLLSLLLKMARYMLNYGAEVYRVEDTINRVCSSFKNTSSVNVLVTYSFVIVSFTYNNSNFSTMRRVVIGEKDLEKISLINDLSRNIVSDKISIDESFYKLKEIKNKKRYYKWQEVFFLSLSSPFFSYLFGGDFRDYLVSFFAMAVVVSFLVYVRFGNMPFLSNFFGAFLGAIFVSGLSRIIFIYNPASIIIAVITPLVPGVQITNCVRDFLAGDYMSGITGIISAIFTSVAIALGVIFALRLINLV